MLQSCMSLILQAYENQYRDSGYEKELEELAEARGLHYSTDAFIDKLRDIAHFHKKFFLDVEMDFLRVCNKPVIAETRITQEADKNAELIKKKNRCELFIHRTRTINS